MPDIDASEPSHTRIIIDPAAIDGRSGKPKQISRKAKAAIRDLLNGEYKTQQAAADANKISRQRLSELILSPAGQAFITRERAKTISIGSLRAAARMVNLIDASSEHVSLDAAKHVLAIEGIAPPQSGTSININNNIAPGYVINMADPRMSTVKDPLTVEHANPLISQDGG